MFRKEQKEQGEIPNELKAMIPFLNLLPKDDMEKQFKKIWAKKTKCFEDPKKNIKEIKKLQTKQTQKIFYKDITVYSWLGKIMAGDETKETKQFIKWYKTEYYKISLKDLGIF